MMENYRKKLKVRNIWYIIAILIATASGIWHTFVYSGGYEAQTGFIVGAAIGVGLMSLMMFFKNAQILKDEKQLALAFNRENDERLRAIRAKSGLPMAIYTSLGMLIAAIIIGYWSFTAFATLVCAGGGQLLVCGAVKMILLGRE